MTRQLPVASTHFVPRISEEASGPTYSVVRLCESLLLHGQEARLVTLRAGTRDTLPFEIQFPVGVGPYRLGRSPAMYKWAKHEAKVGRLGVLHNHSLWMMPNVYPGWIAAKYGVPLIVSPRGTLSQWAMASGSRVKRLFWPLVQAKALRSATCFHATANSEMEEIRRLGFRQPIAVIPNGIDMPELGWKNETCSSRTLLFLGRVHPKKGVDVLLHAWATVQDSHPLWSLRIVGPDNEDYLGEMEALARRLRLERVRFTGARYGLDKWREYASADLFILPTHSENFGMSVAESLAAGTPAIVTKGAPWDDLSRKGAGWWVDGNVDALGAALKVAMGLPAAELRAMGIRGRQWMRADFSWHRVGEMMSQTYVWMISGGTRPSWIYVRERGFGS